MSTYCVTFRIADKTVGGQTYSDRRNMLIRNVRSENAGFWEDTTSFFFVESSMHTNDFANKAVRGLSANDDMAVIFDPSDMSACYFGVVEHVEVLRSFLPLLKKVP